MGQYGSSPRQLTADGQTLFFTADDGVHGHELWKSDGTTAGTVLVKDINPGSSYGYPHGSSPDYLTAVGETLFFAANDGVHGRAVEERRHHRGHRPGQGHQPGQPTAMRRLQPIRLTAVGGTLFFAADDGVHGRELWKSDGTAAGTVLVKDINPAAARLLSRHLTAMGGTLFFTADDGVHGTSCGRATAPRRARSWSRTSTRAALAATQLQPRHLTAVGGSCSSRPTTGRRPELWKSDGTAAGTVLVKDINPGSPYGFPNGSFPTYLTDVGGTLYFTAFDAPRPELWKSDGTAKRHRTGQGHQPGQLATASQANSPWPHGRLAGLYFTANDGTTARSCGRATAPPTAPSWSKTSGQETATTAIRSVPMSVN